VDRTHPWALTHDRFSVDDAQSRKAASNVAEEPRREWRHSDGNYVDLKNPAQA
jgi:hypothetical protein